jgi:zinc transport system substrate-binding protein
VAAAGLALLTGACARAPSGGPRVAVSIFPLYDIARRIGGDRLAVDLMLPPGMFDHEFEPRPKDYAHIADARLVVLVGLDLDHWGRKLAAGASEATIVELAPRLDPLTIPPGVVTLRAAHEEEPGSKDPHFWLDPVRMQEACGLLVQEFSRLDPEGARGFRTRAADVKYSIARVHTDIDRRTRRFSRHSIVTFHGSWLYFADRYGLTIAAVVEASPGREPTPAYVRDVLIAAKTAGASALFSEPQLSRRAAELISQEAGLPLFELDALGGTAGRDSYEALLRYDADVLEAALR